MLGLRSFQRATTATKPAIRHLPARRWASSSELTGAADNAFNRERAAVKEHAAATSGTSSPYLPPQISPEMKESQAREKKKKTIRGRRGASQTHIHTLMRVPQTPGANSASTSSSPRSSSPASTPGVCGTSTGSTSRMSRRSRSASSTLT
uniref:Putative cytochrome C oxidase subunit Via n=1 Tax=Teratosphaeria destructans TaxID=418781 RepID=A0A6C0T4R2_9PEZI|nr:putative cytochrome C oxidase subunit Via [Teratosphaeria destructans]